MPVQLGINLLVSLLSLTVMAMGMIAGSMLVMGLGFLMLGVLGLANFVRLVEDWRSRWSLCGLHGGVLLIWYGVGGFVSLGWGDPWVLGMMDARDYSDLFLAGLYFVLASNGILALSGLEHRFWRPVIERLRGVAPPASPLMLLFLFMLWLTLVNFIWEGRIDFRSLGTGGGQGLPAAELVVYQLSLALSGYFGWVLGRPRDDSKHALVIIGAMFLPFILLVLLGQGRTDLLTHAVTVVLMYAWSRRKMPAWRQRLHVVALMIPLLFLGAMVFQAQRLSSFSVAERWSGPTNLIERLDTAGEVLGQEWDTVLDSQVETLPLRFFFIGYLKELVGTSDDQRLALGAETVAQMTMAVPTVLLPDKMERVVALGGYAEMRNPDFGLADLTDYADSVLVAAYMDFGWLGIPYAALSVLLMGGLFASMARLFPTELFQVVLISSVLAQFLAAEGQFFIVSANLLRLLAVLAVLSLLLNLVPGGSRRAELVGRV